MFDFIFIKKYRDVRFFIILININFLNLKIMDNTFEKQLVDSSKLKVGMFDCGNGVFVSDVKQKQDVRSIVSYVDLDKKIALGICPKFKMLPWCHTVIGADTIHMRSGKEATAIILERAEELGKSVPAVEFCANYVGYGINKGDAFMPSKTELRRMFIYRSQVREACKKIGVSMFDLKVWSSTIDGKNAWVWMQDFITGTSNWYYQCYTYAAFPVIEIKL